MRDENLRKALDERYEGSPEDERPVLLDNPYFDKSIIGISQDGRLVYSLSSMIDEIMSDEGWDYEEAVEFIEYNTLRTLPYACSMGTGAPIIIETERDEI